MQVMSRIAPLALAATLTSLAGSALAAECDVKLESGTTFRELGEILTCLNGRIADLEAKLDAATGGAGTQSGQVEDIRGALNPDRSAEKNGIAYELLKCRAGRDKDDLVCDVAITNTLESDAEACFGNNSMAITGTGIKGTQVRNFVGVKSNWGPVCDVVPSFVKVTGFVNFNNLLQSSPSQMQLIRVDCGAGCQIQVYDETIR